MSGEKQEKHFELSQDLEKALSLYPEAQRFFDQQLNQLAQFAERRVFALRLFEATKEILQQKAEEIKTMSGLEIAIKTFCEANKMIEYERTMEINPELLREAHKEGKPLTVNQVKTSEPDMELEIEGHKWTLSINYYYLTVCVDGQLWAHYYRDRG